MRLVVRRTGGFALALALVALPACAPNVPPTVGAPRYPGYMFPAVPADLVGTSAAAGHYNAWQFLQAGDFRNAEQAFASVLRQTPAFYPAEAGWGYVELAQRDYDTAVTRFDRALAHASTYTPALVGRGEALLGANRVGDALESLEAALAADPSLATVRRRVQVLRFNRMQEEVALARQATAARRYTAARAAYERAIAASPESAFLLVELARVEFRQRDLQRALEHARRATELDPAEASGLVLEGEIQEALGDLEAAERTYLRAQRLDPTEELAQQLARVRALIKLAALPAQYRAIPDAPQITRAELAALIGVRFDGLLRRTQPGSTVIITDTREHWAHAWVLSVASAGVMDVNVNYTFQPDVGVQRGVLGQVVLRVLNLIAADDRTLAQQWQRIRPRFADLGPGHLSYPAASTAVASGVLPILEGNTFQLTRPVSGAEAIAALERLEALAMRSG